ncbi:MAG: 1-acyl-sn-glycerol-3-phosphate acyltransferase [Flavobacteriales bacterium]|nr:1-acyl-sn-glycerol-3-phosphate acyltransferase [Flavobacteriales bacterium]
MSNQVVKANAFRKVWIILNFAYAMFMICFPTVIENIFGMFKHDVGTGRLKWWTTKMVRDLRVNIKVINSSNFSFEKGKRYIIMSNHSSFTDIPFAMHAMGPTIRFMSKADILKIPIVGPAMRASGFVSVDRRSSFQAQKDLEYAKKKLGEGIQLWVAPEGTRTKDGKLLPFKRGVFKMAMEVDAIIIPLGLRGCDKVVPAGKLEIYLNENVEAHIGTPVNTSDYTKETMKDLIDETRNQILKLKGEVA